MSRILWVLLLVGCTQTSTTVEPINIACEARCAPGGECWATFDGEGEEKIDQSTLGPEELSGE